MQHELPQEFTNLDPIANKSVLRASYYFRDIVATGFATLTRISETSILAGSATRYLDILKISGANSTGVAARVNIRSGTGGSIVDSIVIPANDIFDKKYDVPLPTSELDLAWTAQWSNSTGEISDSPITVSVIAVKSPKRDF